MKHVQGITLTHLKLKLLMLNYKKSKKRENKKYKEKTHYGEEIY